MNDIDAFNELRIEDGLEPVATVWMICEHCRGEGTLAGWPGAYTEADREEWSEEDYESYRTWRRNCEDCDGTGKVRGISSESPMEVRHAFYDYCRDMYELRSIEAQERRMGA